MYLETNDTICDTARLMHEPTLIHTDFSWIHKCLTHISKFASIFVRTSALKFARNLVKITLQLMSKLVAALHFVAHAKHLKGFHLKVFRPNEMRMHCGAVFVRRLYASCASDFKDNGLAEVHVRSHYTTTTLVWMRLGGPETPFTNDNNASDK